MTDAALARPNERDLQPRESRVCHAPATRWRIRPALVARPKPDYMAVDAGRSAGGSRSRWGDFDRLAFAGCDRRGAEPLEGEPQAQEQLPDDLRDGRDALHRGALRDHAEQHCDA